VIIKSIYNLEGEYMANKEKYINELKDEQIKFIETTYNAIRTLEEEKKSIAEDVKDEKNKCSKETGVKLSDLNDIFKLLKLREKGFDPKKYDNVIEKIGHV